MRRTLTADLRAGTARDPGARAVGLGDAESLAALMLGAYRGSIDDAGAGHQRVPLAVTCGNTPAERRYEGLGFVDA